MGPWGRRTRVLLYGVRSTWTWTGTLVVQAPQQASTVGHIETGAILPCSRYFVQPYLKLREVQYESTIKLARSSCSIAQLKRPIRCVLESTGRSSSSLKTDATNTTQTSE